jgi:DUF1680 family protein
MKNRLLIILALVFSMSARSENSLYPEHFELSEVTLSEGPLKTALDLNIEMLMSYDVDRLLTPFVRQAGLNSGQYKNWTSLHPNFENWGSGSFRLDGHVGGHYLSALALAYAACHDDAVKAQLKERMDYMVGVMKDCQDVFNNNTSGLYGYIGGYPDNSLWTNMYSGSMDKFNGARGNVPLYVQHKVMAGLRDAYIYGKNEDARAMFLKICDWAINLVAKYNTSTMQSVLDTEHGGVNEVLADAYQLTGESKYLAGAKKYSHTTMVNGMQTLNTSFLDNRHANTQVPKYIGFERIAQLDASMTSYATAARNFWTDVTANRTVCIGGNSMNEWFMASSASQRYVNECNGPESCNTNNMLKLSESLFDATHDGKYVDFYEDAMYNHILSTQDPVTGGYVYFTPLRPQAYRIYSKVNQDMWCCVGTGMENHSKYGHFIYTHSTDNNTLYINLFTASELNSDKFALKQETQFPQEAKTKITLTKGGSFTLAVRKPSWVAEGYGIKVNGSDKAFSISSDGYAKITDNWSAGDVIEVNLPMTVRYEQCPNLKEYIAFKYGPILLGARTTSNDPDDPSYEALVHEYAEGERMGHAEDSYTTKKNLATAPLLIGKRSEVLARITPVAGKPLTFTIDASREGSEAWDKLTLEPYYSLHHSRVMNYWYQATQEEYDNSSWAKDEREAAALDARTIDFIRTGEQQSEAGVTEYSDDSTVGTFNDEVYRDAKAGGWIQYILTNSEGITENVGLMCRFNVADKGRKAAIYVDGTLIQEYTVPSSVATANENGFYNKEWLLDESLLKDGNGQPKQTVTFRIQADFGTLCPGLYYLRLTKEVPDPFADYVHFSFKCTDFRYNPDQCSSISYDETANSFTLQGKSTGQRNVSYAMKLDAADKYFVKGAEYWYVIEGQGLSVANAIDTYAWWMNGYNVGAQVQPNKYFELERDNQTYQVFAWDLSKQPQLNGNFPVDEPKVAISNFGKDWIDCIGLTTSNQSTKRATITMVDYMSEEAFNERYPSEEPEELGEDITATYIKNPSFEANVGTKVIPTNWALSNTSLAWYGINNANGNDDNPTDGTRLFGVWNGSSVAVTLSQQVTLPKGRYALTADMLASNRSNVVRLGNQRIFAGNNIAYFKDQCDPGVGDNVPLQTVRLDFSLDAESTISLGAATSDAPAETWFKVDNFRLYKQSDDPTGVSSLLENKTVSQIKGKLYENGKIYIISNGIKYSTTGARVK